MVLPAYNTIAWGLLKGYPWWPVYVFDPKKLRPDLYHLGSAHQQILEQAKAEPHKWRIVYYFASYDFGLHSSAQLKTWGGKDHETFKAGYPATSCIEPKVVEQFLNALREVEDYLSTDPSERTLPYIDPSELDSSLSPPRPDVIDLADSDDDSPSVPTNPTLFQSPVVPRLPAQTSDDVVSSVPYNSLAWARPQGLPWWPVYVCDPSQLREDLHHLGRNHVPLLTRARNEPHENCLVYYFGRYMFGLLKTKVKPWNCSEHSVYENGHPKETFHKRVELVDEFAIALAEAKACFPSNGRSGPTIPYLEASDLKKSLPAPPTLVVPALSLGWTSKDGFPWLPVYVLDPSTVNPVLNHLGNKHAQGLQDALANPDELRLVYIFGCHEIISRPIGAVKPWQGAQHANFVRGFPKSVKNAAALDTLAKALEEAKNFIKASKDSRRLPFMNKEDIQFRRQDGPSASKAARTSVNPKAAPQTPSKKGIGGSPTQAKKKKTAQARSKYAGSLSWIKPINQPWWPVYVCDTQTFQPNLHFLGKSHAPLLAKAKANMTQHRLIYYLGRHVFGLHKASELQPWDCAHQSNYLNAPPIPGNSDEESAEFTSAISEALRFAECGKLEYITPNDVDPTVPSPDKQVIPYNSLAWVLREGFPWMPVYVFDPNLLKPSLANLGNGHAPLMENAIKRPTLFRLVYYFGTHELGLHRSKGVFRSWLGPDHDNLVKGLPRSMFVNKHGREWRSKNPFMFTIFETAMNEVADFVAQAPSNRLLPHLVPSDLTSGFVPFTPFNEGERRGNAGNATDEVYSNESGDDDCHGREVDSDHGLDVDEVVPGHKIQVPPRGPYDVLVWSPISKVLWLPAYVCDPFKMRSTVDTWGSKYVEMLQTVRAAPNDKRLVYFFGDHCFGVRRPTDMIRPWNCPEHEQFMRIALEQNPNAWDEAQAYSLEDSATRLLPGFTETEMRRSARDSRASSDDEDEGYGPKLHTTSVQSKPVRPRDVEVPSHSPKRRKSSASSAPTDPRKRVQRAQPPPMAKKRVVPPTPSTTEANQSSWRGQGAAKGHEPPEPLQEPSLEQPENSSTSEGESHSCSPKDLKPSEPKRHELKIAPVAIQDIPLNSLAWARMNDTPWWPVYVCDAEKVQPSLKHMGTRHRTLLNTAKEYPHSLRLVYIFGSSPSFGVCSKNMTLWQCAEHSALLKGHPAHALSGRVMRDFTKAVRDAVKYHDTDAYTRLLPDMAESDMSRYIPPQVPQNSVAWVKTGDDAPWRPGFLCDHNALDPSEHDLGKINDRIMRIIQDNPFRYRIVYFFGSRQFGVLKPKSSVQWWNCPNHTQYVEGYPSNLCENIDLEFAVKDTEAFLASDRLSNLYPFDQESESHRLRQFDDRAARKPAPNLAPAPVAPSVDLASPPPSSAPGEPHKNDAAPPKARRGRQKKQPTISDTTTIVGAPPPVSTTWTSNACVSWAKVKGYPWWPSYICDPNKLRDELVLLGNGHRSQLQQARQRPTTHKLVYYFGSNSFGLQIVDPSNPQSVIKPWNCEDHKLFRGGYPIKMSADSKNIVDEFKDAVKEAEAFLDEDPSMRLLPYMVPTDMDLTLRRPPDFPIPLNAMVWALCDSYPWMPAFVCDPSKLLCNKDKLSPQQKKLLARAMAKPDECWLVYYFGVRTFALHKTRGTIKLWDCSEYQNFVRGYAESLIVADDAWEEFANAIADAKDFMSKDENSRELPGMETMVLPIAPDAIDLTLSPDSTTQRKARSIPDLSLEDGVVPPQRSKRCEVRPGIRHHRFKLPVHREEYISANSNLSDDEAAIDDDVEAGIAASNRKLKQTKRAVDLVSSRMTPDDFKYNPAQRQFLQAIEIKAEVPGNEADASTHRLKRHKGAASDEASTDTTIDAPIVVQPSVVNRPIPPLDGDHGIQNMSESAPSIVPVESPSDEMNSTGAASSRVMQAKEHGAEMIDGAGNLNATDGVVGTAHARTEWKTHVDVHSKRTADEVEEHSVAPVESANLTSELSDEATTTPLSSSAHHRVMWAFVDGLRWWPVHPIDGVNEKDFTTVVHFGTYKRSLLPWDALRPWRCEDHAAWVANAATEEGYMGGEFTHAIKEAEDFLKTGDWTASWSQPNPLKDALDHAPCQDESNASLSSNKPVCHDPIAPSATSEAEVD
ncbi:hypothetical protein, variant 1 [Aphanomyces invadans]|uniref:PWWP domain-containing protein n=1 Tax=Aphanomyces invadans TaxID=157072 RepID=A0A024UHI3_9STRA|nr:hypothetical protein, variant 1 [Aphanomyces invadans]ETW05073.1 hypothetical protein, variant 1 [Aphanomyces invadans]|eukprot:XP_008866511.1 hypothetical protein, variant 1 [Aphanomyces invadans]